MGRCDSAPCYQEVDVTLLLAALRVLALVMSPPGAWVAERGKASTFTCHEALNNCRLPCEGGRSWTDDEFIVAHRTAPCGSIFVVTNPKTGKSVVAVKADAGPWGALMPDGTWVIKRPGDAATAEAKYRGVLDMSWAVRNAIGASSMGVVKVRWIAPPWRSRRDR